MSQITFAIFALAALVQCIRCRSADNRCPGGYTDGTQVDIGRYWYECSQGKMAPKGCLSEDGQRVDVGGTYDKDTFRMQCVLNTDGYLSVMVKSCMQGGVERNVNERWDDGSVVYACKKDGSTSLKVALVGCMHQGRRVNLDDKVEKNDGYVYRCDKNSAGKPVLTNWGCASNGRQYAIGETFEDDHKWYSCTVNQDKLHAKCVGCLYESKRMKDGDRYFRDDVIYSCSVDEENTKFKPTGCVQRLDGSEVERRLGCFWVEGRAPYEYEMTCKYDESAKTAVKVVHKCTYAFSRGTVSMQPGCYYVYERTAIACVKGSSESDVKIVTLPTDEDGTIPNLPGGVRRC